MALLLRCMIASNNLLWMELSMNSGLGGTPCEPARDRRKQRVAGTGSGSSPRQGHSLPLSAIALAVALVAAMPQQASAANCTASTETELRNAITTANADGAFPELACSSAGPQVSFSNRSLKEKIE